tara:strand:- start:2636 stop:3172 length:537 start_codon:yes stop_codon:yes gene_type:complete
MSSKLGVENIAHTNGTNAMTISSGGVATFNNTPNLSTGAMTNAPAFKATRSSSAQTIPGNSWTQVLFNDELLDTDNCYDPTTNFRFTPNVAGKYWIYAHIYSGVGNQYIYGAIAINGTRKLASNIDASQAGGVYIAGIFTFNGSSDYVEAQTYQGPNAGNISTSEEFAVFGGYKLIGI